MLFCEDGDKKMSKRELKLQIEQPPLPPANKEARNHDLNAVYCGKIQSQLSSSSLELTVIQEAPAVFFFDW